MPIPTHPVFRIYLETGDVARERGVVAATVRGDVKAGHLRVAATTLRGLRLFVREDVDAYLLARGPGRRMRMPAMPPEE